MRINSVCVLILLFEIVCSSTCASQAIDTNALKILTTSFDKVAEQKKLTYSMLFSFASGDNENISVREIDVSYINTIDNENTVFYFRDGSAKYITKDSLYMLSANSIVSAMSNVAIHQHSTYSIKNVSINDMLVATNREFIDEWIDTIRFYKPLATGASEYVIEVIDKNREWNNGTIKSKLLYNRYWIDSQSLLPTKRQKWFQTINDLGKEQIDITEFFMSFPDRNPVRNFPLSIFKDAQYRNVQKTSLSLTENNTGKNLLGSLAPGFSAKNLYSGKPENLSLLKGKVVLLDFWYLSCLPCRTLMPVLNQINEKYKEKDFVLLGVNATDTDRTKIKAYIDSKRYTYKQWYMPVNTIKLYNIDAFPTTVLIDKSGHVKFYDSGYFDDIGSVLSKLIEVELNK